MPLLLPLEQILSAVKTKVTQASQVNQQQAREHLREQLLLYAVTDRTWLGDRQLTADVEQALLGGVTLLQLREKDLPFEVFMQEAIAVKTLCDRHAVPLIINDNVEVALASDAAGVHVGQSDLPVSKARQVVGASKIVGVSVQTVEQAVVAQASGADYLGVGAMFPTNTKTDAEVVTLATLRAITAAVRIPVCVIGGISAENIQQFLGTGVAGFALVSALFAQTDIRAAATSLCALAKTAV
jgi:thiamine-phosphate pyrophosphorylase